MVKVDITKACLVTIKVIAVGAIVLTVACKNTGSPNGEIPTPRQPRTSPTGKVKVDHNVKLGDRLEIFVAEDESFNGIYPVRENGDIIINRVGRIPVAGFSVKEAEKRVKLKLEQGQLAKATVIVDRVSNVNKPGVDGLGSSTSGHNRILVYMTGKVERPGQHRIAVPEGRSLGVYEALLISGGMGRFADPRKVHILRSDESGKRVKVGVDVKKIINGELADMPIGEGDVIVVPEKVFGF